MPKVILICGKICCGKTTYAKKLVKEQNTVLLSCDEITLALFGQHIGEKHGEMVERTMKYLFNKSLEVVSTGVNVILDFGFWTRDDRGEAASFYKQNSITTEWHYIDVSSEVWIKNLAKRNQAIESGKTDDYYIDDNIANKFWRIFEEPTTDEIDVWYKNDWE